MSLLTFGVPHLTTYILFLFVNQPELEVLIDLAWHLLIWDENQIHNLSISNKVRYPIDRIPSNIFIACEITFFPILQVYGGWLKAPIFPKMN